MLSKEEYNEAQIRKATLKNTVDECDAEIDHLRGQIDKVKARKGAAKSSLKLYDITLAKGMADYERANPPKQMEM